MSLNPLISILMPVKNEAAFLRECLVSIISQTEPNWELIAIDDHSNDASRIILEEFSAKENRVAVYTNNGQGIIPALRMAYSISNGSLITRMDADDFMSPIKLMELKRVLLQKGKGHVVIGKVKYFSTEILGNGYKKYESWLNNLTSNADNYNELYKECVIPSPCWMLHREDLDKCGAFEPNTYPEDYDLCFRLYREQLKVASSCEILHHWRDHMDRSSRTLDHYSDNGFIDLKVNYFIELDYRPSFDLCLWGAGKKGKRIARELIHNNIPFTWFCNNEKKIGRSIYDQVMRDQRDMSASKRSQVIVCVANPDERAGIKQTLADHYKKSISYFFC